MSHLPVTEAPADPSTYHSATALEALDTYKRRDGSKGMWALERIRIFWSKFQHRYELGCSRGAV